MKRRRDRRSLRRGTAIDIGVNSASLLWLLRNRAGLEEVGEVIDVGRVGEIGAGGAEDVLHGANIGGVRERDRACVRKAVHVWVRAIGDDDFAHGVIEVVGVDVRGAVTFGFVPPEDDDAVVF